MPLTLKELQGGERTVPVTYEGEVVNVTYCPGRLTPTYITNIRKKKLEEQIAELVVRWDIVDGSKPVPVTVDIAAELPIAFLAAITNAINEDMRPNARNGATSDVS